MLTITAGILGLMMGSFANVCVYRIPRRESIAVPASHCPSCGHSIAFRDNIPLLSWLLLKGRCRYCTAHIPWRYPFLEAVMGLSFAGLAWLYGATPMLLSACSLAFLLWTLTLIDLETFSLPNALTFPGIILGLAFSWWFGHFQDAFIGAFAGYWIFWLVAKLFLLTTGREGMGYGDFKLLAMLGAFMGWQALPFIIFASSIVGLVVGSAFLLLSHRGIRAEIPFGPYLALAGIIWFVAGGEITTWYLRFSGVVP